MKLPLFDEFIQHRMPVAEVCCFQTIYGGSQVNETTLPNKVENADRAGCSQPFDRGSSCPFPFVDKDDVGLSRDPNFDRRFLAGIELGQFRIISCGLRRDFEPRWWQLHP